jgi:integrase
MPRKLEGQMRFTMGEWRVRLSVYVSPGKRERKWFGLGTADRTLAERKRAKLIDELALAENNVAARAGEALAPLALPVPQAAPQLERFAGYARRWCAKRASEGVAFAESQTIHLEKHILSMPLAPGDLAPTFGDLLLPDVRPRHVRLVLETARDIPMSPQSLTHLRGTIGGVLASAVEDELVTENVAKKVRVPKPRKEHRHLFVRRPRIVLVDTEIDQFFACDRAPLEIRIMGATSRTQGGMRTLDLTTWTWPLINTFTFALCTIPRTKTLSPQELEIPAVLQGPLRQWWVDQGSPTEGPVFPVTRGKRKGEARKTRGVSFAKRLRRALMDAGVKRHICEHPDVRPSKKKPCCPAFLSDPLYYPKAGSLPVDFHSFRRAFSTGLAEAGVNAQQAMVLAGHSDPRAHGRYIAATAELSRVPAGALPTLKRPREVAVPFVSLSPVACDDPSGSGCGEQSCDGLGSAGFAAISCEQPASQAEGREFESRVPLWKSFRFPPDAGSASRSVVPFAVPFDGLTYGATDAVGGPADAAIRAKLRATRWTTVGAPLPCPPAGLVEAEVNDAAASHRAAEIRQLLGDGVGLAFARAGDPAGFDVMAALLGRVVELVQTGGAS